MRTDLIPFTFHDEMKSLSGVFPVPYYQSVSLDLPCETPSLNCLDLDLVGFDYYSTTSLEKSLVCFSFLSYSGFATDLAF